MRYLIAGIVFGIILVKSQVVSWYRIFEMFRFDSFHMYGIIGSAVIVGLIAIQMMKRSQAKSIDGEKLSFKDKDFSWSRYLIGGTIFGLGWAMVGACPGPIFVLIGMGFVPMIVVAVGAILGTWVYGRLRDRLPH